jgi:hypothetical protein
MVGETTHGEGMPKVDTWNYRFNPPTGPTGIALMQSIKIKMTGKLFAYQWTPELQKALNDWTPRKWSFDDTRQFGTINSGTWPSAENNPLGNFPKIKTEEGEGTIEDTFLPQLLK